MRYLRPLAAACVLSLCAVPSAFAREEAEPAQASPPESRAPDKPALVLAISVDQFSADLFAQYRAHFSGGLARLLEGAVFPQGFQSHAATETCPGHSTILTGAHPARTGIVANNWFVPGIARKDKRVYCAEDESDPESTSGKPVVSPVHLKVPTLGDLMKRADPASKNVAVSAKDRASVMMSGHSADAAYWYDDGAFVTFKDRAMTRAALHENDDLRAILASGAPAMAVPEWCARADRPVSIGDIEVGTYRFALDAGDAKGLRSSPRMDAATGDLAVRLVDEQGLGRDGATDVLSVSFSATDYVGHAYGTQGVEMCIQLAALDATIGKLFAALDARGIDYVAMLTADHGGFDVPERLTQQGYADARRMSPALEIEALAAEIGKATGIAPKSGKLLYGGVQGDIWYGDGLTAGQERALDKALIKRLSGDPEVAWVRTAAQIAALPMPAGDPQDWTVEQKVRASFDPARSGDLLVMLRRGISPIAEPDHGYTATHGSPWDYDRRVPILFWRKGLAGFEQPDPVETVDIAPTLAAVIGLDAPAGTWDGRCLDIDGGTGDTCAR